MRIIFSRDRPAQLDLLLRSIYEGMTPGKIGLIAYASTDEFEQGYWQVLQRLGAESMLTLRENDFNSQLRVALDEADEYVTFFCDDDVLIRRVIDYESLFPEMQEFLTVSLRLGRENTQMRWPGDEAGVWEWKDLPRHDFGFPASIDGHTFHTEDVLEMIGDDVIENPTMLETVMALRVEGLAERRPLMCCFGQQKLVGVPVNRVSPSSGVVHGQQFPQSTEELNARWLAGEQIKLLGPDDFPGLGKCHQEVQYKWQYRPL